MFGRGTEPAARQVRPPSERLASVRLRWSAAAVGICLLVAAAAAAEQLELRNPSRLLVGVGDRMTVRAREARPGENAKGWVSLPELARESGLALGLFEVWLTRGWHDDWVDGEQLRALAKRGITPVVIHYYFGDRISRERVEDQRDDWYSSMWRMAKLVRMDAPVLVVLEPEFNVTPPRGETAITDWPGFAEDLRAAARMIRKQAPNALVGTCPGDFPGAPNLEPVLGPVADDLDFLAFQEMRASTDPEAERPGYLEVGKAATEYARYLKRAFGRPILLAYVAVSSYGGWEQQQADALRDLARHQKALRKAGVFGWVYFQLRDDPRHRGYFGRAERAFGLQHVDGAPKPAFEPFRAMANDPG